MAGLLKFDEGNYEKNATYNGATIHQWVANFGGINLPVYHAWSLKTAWFPRSGPGYKHLWRLLKRIDEIG